MNFLQLMAIIWEKAKLNLKAENADSYLNYAWWVLEPLLHLVCYYTVFELILHRGGPGFVFFLLSGLIPWLWFARSITSGANSLVRGRGLMAQMYMPKIFFPLVSIVELLLKQLIIFALLMVFLWLSGHTVSVRWLAMVPLVITQLMLMLPVAMALAIVIVIVRDIQKILPSLIQFLFFGSGIFFDITRLPESLQKLAVFNPVMGLLVNYRAVLLSNEWPDFRYLAIVGLSSLVALCIVLVLYKMLDQAIAKAVTA